MWVMRLSVFRWIVAFVRDVICLMRWTIQRQMYLFSFLCQLVWFRYSIPLPPTLSLTPTHTLTLTHTNANLCMRCKCFQLLLWYFWYQSLCNCTFLSGISIKTLMSSSSLLLLRTFYFIFFRFFISYSIQFGFVWCVCLRRVRNMFFFSFSILSFGWRPSAPVIMNYFGGGLAIFRWLVACWRVWKMLDGELWIN